MNDVPAVVAWLLTVPIALAVTIVWRRVRRLPLPGMPGWRWRTVGWAGAAATAGPLVVAAIVVVVGTVINWRTLVVDPTQAIALAVGSLLYLGMWYLFVSLAFFLLPYVPLLLLWARLGPTLGRLESTLGGVALSAALLALPGALVTVAAYALLDQPFGYQGGELLSFGLVILGGISVSLLVPRLIFPALRPGAFAGSPANDVSGTLPDGVAAVIRRSAESAPHVTNGVT